MTTSPTALRELATYTVDQLRGQAEWCRRRGHGDTADMLEFAASVLVERDALREAIQRVSGVSQHNRDLSAHSGNKWNEAMYRSKVNALDDVEILAAELAAQRGGKATATRSSRKSPQSSSKRTSNAAHRAPQRAG